MIPKSWLINSAKFPSLFGFLQGVLVGWLVPMLHWNDDDGIQMWTSQKVKALFWCLNMSNVYSRVSRSRWLCWIHGIDMKTSERTLCPSFFHLPGPPAGEEDDRPLGRRRWFTTRIELRTFQLHWNKMTTVVVNYCTNHSYYDYLYMIQKRWGKHQPGASSSSNNIRDTQIELFFRNHQELRGGWIWKNPGIFREDQLFFGGYMPYHEIHSPL